MIGAALPLRESLLIAWPQAVGLIASAIVLFVVVTWIASSDQWRDKLHWG